MIAALDLATLAPLLVALVSGGAVALYTARPHKDSIIAAASEKAVVVVSTAITRLETDLSTARERIAVLEVLVRDSNAALSLATARIEMLRAEVNRLGGDVEEINRVGKRGPRGEKGPDGDHG